MIIKSKADAKTLAEMFISEDPRLLDPRCPAYGATKSSIQLWDSLNSNRVMIHTQTLEDKHQICFIDTVLEIAAFEVCSVELVAEMIWHNRKYINQSRQLINL